MKADNLEKVDDELRQHAKRVRTSHGLLERFEVDEVTITYGELAARSGVGTARGEKPYLDAIADRCRERNEPLLDCLVVNKKLRMPGQGRPTSQTRNDWRNEVIDCVRFNEREPNH